jgi:hypothetical protein
LNIYDSLKNPLHRYIVDYQGFNPLQTLISTRYKPATGRRPASYEAHQPAVKAAQKPKFRPKARHFYSTENSEEPKRRLQLVQIQ